MDCLRAATPALQYTEAKERTASLRGSGFKPTGERAASQELPMATAPAATAVPHRTLRHGLGPATIAAVSTLNDLPDGSKRSPVVLCEPSELAFGKNLTAQLLASCKGGAPTSGTDNLAYLLPQAVGDVTKGEVKKAGSAAVLEALWGKL